MTDHSTVLEVSAPIAHFMEFFCSHGAPANGDAARPVSIIVNHGYALGFSPARLQPVWAAYQVSAAKRDVDYERPEFFLDDPRIPPDCRIGTGGFGKLDGTSYDRGHLVPNFAINTQFGRVAQFETFFMSNIFPQHASTNRGAWQRLEQAIVRAYAPLRKQVWAMAGPIFGDDPPMVVRRNGLKIPVPEATFLILADPERYPFDEAGNLSILALRMPQDWGNKALGDDLITTLPDIERATGLTFFPRLSARDKAKLVNQTSPMMWPLEAIAEAPRDPQPPQG
ncbi:DNA/RNA non-specific endonuclease [Brevundimonas sp.]|uniref:DNA/RNA non-specific endonuclease n=1 Tax=Brevundimonas sp. TaxID=1871086 RepID=UPI0026204EDE|nr:DNA/RNA non-specific endonuclease [Brevundimonas sp.]